MCFQPWFFCRYRNQSPLIINWKKCVCMMSCSNVLGNLSSDSNSVLKSSAISQVWVHTAHRWWLLSPGWIEWKVQGWGSWATPPASEHCSSLEPKIAEAQAPDSTTGLVTSPGFRKVHDMPGQLKTTWTISWLHFTLSCPVFGDSDYTCATISQCMHCQA